MELRIWNFELVGFADYSIMNYSLFTIHYGQRPSGFAFLRKCSIAAKITFGIKYFISTEMKIEGENFGALRLIF